jgi:hypothetical protein
LETIDSPAAILAVNNKGYFNRFFTFRTQARHNALHPIITIASLWFSKASHYIEIYLQHAIDEANLSGAVAFRAANI